MRHKKKKETGEGAQIIKPELYILKDEPYTPVVCLFVFVSFLYFFLSFYNGSFSLLPPSPSVTLSSAFPLFCSSKEKKKDRKNSVSTNFLPGQQLLNEE